MVELAPFDQLIAEGDLYGKSVSITDVVKDREIDDDQLLIGIDLSLLINRV